MWLLSTTKHSFICMMFIFSFLRTIHGFKDPKLFNHLFLYCLCQFIYIHTGPSTGRSVFHGIKVRSTWTSWNLIIVPFATRLRKSLDLLSMDFKFQNALQMILCQPYDWRCGPPGWTPELRITVKFQFCAVPSHTITRAMEEASPSTQDGAARVVPATCPGKQEHLTVCDRSSILFLLQHLWSATTSQVPVLTWWAAHRKTEDEITVRKLWILSPLFN